MCGRKKEKNAFWKKWLPNRVIDEDERLRRMIIEEMVNLDIEWGYACAANLIKEQQFAYNAIMEKVKSESSGAFFIDGSGGIGKTFFI